MDVKGRAGDRAPPSGKKKKRGCWRGGTEVEKKASLFGKGTRKYRRRGGSDSR